jgi:hypothetical protein
MSRRKKGGPPLSYRKLPPEDRAFLEQRQTANGFSDIDGLKAEMTERGYVYSRSEWGKVSAYLCRLSERLIDRQKVMTGIIQALGPNIQDTGLVNIAMLHDAMQTVMEKLEPVLAQMDMSELSPAQAIATLSAMAKIHAESTKPLTALKNERRMDMKEAQDKLALLEKEAQAGGLDMATLQKVREVYGFQD